MSASARYSGALSPEPIVSATPAITAAMEALVLAAHATAGESAQPSPAPVFQDMVEHYAFESARTASHYAAFS